MEGRRCGRRRGTHEDADPRAVRSRRKPAWMQREILRHAALQPQASCRLLANAFNRRHAGRDGVTIGKSFVRALRRQQRCEIMRLRRELRRCRYGPVTGIASGVSTAPARPTPKGGFTSSSACSITARAGA